MNIRSNWLVFSAAALCLGSCQSKKEEPKAADKPAVTTPASPAPEAPKPEDKTPPAPAPVDMAPAPAPATKVTALSPDARAAKLGFAKYLAPDTEVVVSIHQGAKSVDRVKSSKMWKLIQSEMGMGPGMMVEPAMDVEPPAPMELPTDGATPAPAEGEQNVAQADEPKDTDAGLPDAPDAPDAAMSTPGILFGTEFTIAMGRSAGEQTANLLTFNRRMGYFQMRALAKAFAAVAKSGDTSAMEQAFENQYGPELAKDLLADPESGVTLIERLKMPPLYLAFKTTAAQHAGATQQLASLVANLGMMGEMVEPVEVEKAGQKFSGHKISGAKISATMAEEREDMDEMLEPAVVDKLLAAVAKKDLVVLSGGIGDYAVLFIGSSADDFVLAATPAQSLLSSDALAFCDAYTTKDLAAVIYGQKGAVDKMVAAAGGLADMANGLREGLAGAEGLGDTRDLEALLRMVGERESALRKLASHDALGMVAFFEEGFKLESYGGSDAGAIDWKSPNKLAALGDSDEVVAFMNMTSEAAYDEKARAYLEALMETAYAVAMKVSDVKMDDPKMVQFKEGAKLFDSKFRPDLVAMWDAYSNDFGNSLGRERACVIDLNGSVPAIPGIPQEVVDGGKFPRITLVAPVTDRAKLAASWQKINTTLTSVLGKISEMTQQEIPMQKPISSEKDGYTTWFFSVPFFNDDFMPSVTVGDQWFAASTSKTQALDLLNKAAKGGSTRTGMVFTLNFKALQKFARATHNVLEKNSAAILGGNAIPADDMKNIRIAIDAMDDLDKLTIHARREGGVLRSSIHFKTR